MRPKAKMCACDCGRILAGRRTKWATDKCQRDYELRMDRVRKSKFKNDSIVQLLSEEIQSYFEYGIVGFKHTLSREVKSEGITITVFTEKGEELTITIARTK